MEFLSLAGSKLYLNRALGRVHAGAHHLAGLSVHRARAQVADPAGAQAPHAGVADTHPASERKCRAGVLSRREDRLRAVRLAGHAARAEVDRAAASLMGLHLAEVWLEMLDMQGVGVPDLLPP